MRARFAAEPRARRAQRARAALPCPLCLFLETAALRLKGELPLAPAGAELETPTFSLCASFYKENAAFVRCTSRSRLSKTSAAICLFSSSSCCARRRLE